MKKRSASSADFAFLNLPFEPDYEPIFVGFIVGLVTVGLIPRSVVELNENGDGRLIRLFDLMKECPISLHDLSYVGPEIRHNMPFELGLAYALSRDRSRGRTILVFESTRRDLLKTLTDLRGFDPKVHEMDGKKALSAIYNSFVSPNLPDPETIGLPVYEHVLANLVEFRKGQSTIFNKRSFALLVHFVKTQTTKAKPSATSKIKFTP